ncbi:MAG: hypothetical protein OSJ28_07330 [Desulfovibrio sp.]|nr:hypothetical protein [Desulfovibrio sp.]
MSKSSWIEIARAGTFTDSAGRPQTFTDSDLAAIANAYDPAKRDCPLVFGHPKTDAAPAFGWAEKLKAEGGRLLAQFGQVPDAVKKIVADGHYRHVSMSLMPDRKTLRHVALLGATQPAIDGLKAIELASREDCITVDFSTSTEGKEMPDNESQREIGALKERLAALEKENAHLKEQAKGHKDGKEKAEAEKKAAEEKEAKTAADFAAYKGAIENEKREARVAALVESGKVRPAEKAAILSFAMALASQNTTVDFAAPDGKIEKVSLEERYFRELESRNPDCRIIEFSAPPKHVAEANAASFFDASELTSKL